mgnify:CR=1 FL=1
MNWRTRIEPFTRPLFFAWSRMNRGMTLGVRGVATDAGGQVLLVKHTYLQVCSKGFRKFWNVECQLTALERWLLSPHCGQTFRIQHDGRSLRCPPSTCRF